MNAKYLYLPDQYHHLHDICVGLVGDIEEFLIKPEFAELSAQAIPIDETLLPQLQAYDKDIFQFLLEKGKKEEHDKIVKLSLIRGLILDSCYFLQEGLTCSLKMRQVVSFAMFRRPLVYNFKIILRLLVEQDFLGKFINGKDPHNPEKSFDPTRMKSERLLEILNTSLFEPIGGSKVFQYVFDIDRPDSLINMTNRALHPVTSFNKNNQTGAMNINFIFSNQNDILSQWEYIYSKILYVIFFYVTTIDLLVFANIKVEESIVTERMNRRKILMDSFNSLEK